MCKTIQLVCPAGSLEIEKVTQLGVTNGINAESVTVLSVRRLDRLMQKVEKGRFNVLPHNRISPTSSMADLHESAASNL